MDIRNLFAKPKELKIVLPNGEDTGITFMVVGQDSKQYRAASNKAGNMRLNSPKDKKVDLSDVHLAAAEIAAACVVGWTGVQEDGVDVPYTPEKALELLKMPELGFIVEQLDAFVTERAQFFRVSEAKPN